MLSVRADDRIEISLVVGDALAVSPSAETGEQPTTAGPGLADFEILCVVGQGTYGTTHVHCLCLWLLVDRSSEPFILTV